VQITIVLALAALLIPAGASASPAPTWPQDGYGPGNTGYNPSESRLNLGTVDDLRLRWTARPAPGVEGCTHATDPPLVAGGRAVVREGDGIGARDVQTGKLVWQQLGFSLLGRRVAIGGGQVFLTDSNCYSQSSYDGDIIALSLATGTVSWRARLSGTVDKLVVDGGLLVVHGYCGTCDEDMDQVIAYRVADGAKLWSRNYVDLAGEVSAGRRVLLSSTVSSTPKPFGTEAVALLTGKAAWRSGQAWQALSASPSGDRFLATGGTGFSSVTAGTGKVAWSVRSKAGSLSTDGRRVYAAGSVLTAYEAGRGRKLWSRKLREPGKPIRAGGLLYVTTTGPALAILAPATGRTVAPGGAYRTAIGHVVVTGGRLFTTDGTAIRAYAG